MYSNLEIAKNYSQFIDSKLLAYPDWTSWVDEQSSSEVDYSYIQKLFSAHLGLDFKNLSEEEFLSRLRTVRQKIMLVLGVRDLAMGASISEVMLAATTLAEISLDYVAEYLANSYH